MKESTTTTLGSHLDPHHMQEVVSSSFQRCRLQPIVQGASSLRELVCRPSQVSYSWSTLTCSLKTLFSFGWLQLPISFRGKQLIRSLSSSSSSSSSAGYRLSQVVEPWVLRQTHSPMSLAPLGQVYLLPSFSSSSSFLTPFPQQSMSSTTACGDLAQESSTWLKLSDLLRGFSISSAIVQSRVLGPPCEYRL